MSIPSKPDAQSNDWKSITPEPLVPLIARVRVNFRSEAAKLRPQVFNRELDGWAQAFAELACQTFRRVLFKIALPEVKTHVFEPFDWAFAHIQMLTAEELDQIKGEPLLHREIARRIQTVVVGELDAAVKAARIQAEIGDWRSSQPATPLAQLPVSFGRLLQAVADSSGSAVVIPSDRESNSVHHLAPMDSTPIAPAELAVAEPATPAAVPPAPVSSAGAAAKIEGKATEARPDVAQQQPAAQTPPLTNEFRREGEVWRISYEGEQALVPTSLGLEYVAQLLTRPGHSIACTRLEALSTTKRPVFQSVSAVDFESECITDNDHVPQESIDKKAENQYKAEAKRLAEQIADARDRGDSQKVEQLTSELEAIMDELEANTGRGGKRRNFPGPSEKARLRVTNAINRAMEKLEQSAPKTAAHLRENIRTGTSVVYLNATTAWTL